MGHAPYPLDQWQDTPMKYNLRMMVKFASSEYKMYLDDEKNNRNRIIHLQEAGEKLFNSVELYVQIIYGIMGGSHPAVANMIQEETLLKFFYRSNALHEFFYEGEAGIYKRKYIEKEFVDMRNTLNERIKKLR